MISKFGVLLIAAAVAYCSAQPACTCTREMKPVCGTDGVTYSNKCMLNCAKETSKTDITVAKLGPCEKENEPTCICTFEYNPVCGTNGKTYSNPCEATCNKVQIETYGECDQIKVAQLPPCTCSKEKKEVCGTDGATYPNACLLNCATAANSRLGIAHYGPCEQSEVTTPEAENQEACTCTRNFQPVCGNDGVTYNNDCLLQCAGKKKTQDGACEEIRLVNEATPSVRNPTAGDLVARRNGVLLIAGAVACCTAQPVCNCTTEIKQVCGSDGVSYPNECTLNCVKDTLKTDITVATLGPCEKDYLSTCTYGCRFAHKLVCGSDGKTYSSPCEARCHNAQIEAFGECEKIMVPEIPSCTCSKEKEEVCGTDGATYTNVCLLNCATTVNSRLGIAHYGPCEELEVTPLEVASQEACTCTRNFQPVCGNDGVTYNNDCLLQCAGKTKRQDGACEEENFADY